MKAGKGIDKAVRRPARMWERKGIGCRAGLLWERVYGSEDCEAHECAFAGNTTIIEAKKSRKSREGCVEIDGGGN